MRLVLKSVGTAAGESVHTVHLSRARHALLMHLLHGLPRSPHCVLSVPLLCRSYSLSTTHTALTVYLLSTTHSVYLLCTYCLLLTLSTFTVYSLSTTHFVYSLCSPLSFRMSTCCVLAVWLVLTVYLELGSILEGGLLDEPTHREQREHLFGSGSGFGFGLGLRPNVSICSGSGSGSR